MSLRFPVIRVLINVCIAGIATSSAEQLNGDNVASEANINISSIVLTGDLDQSFTINRIWAGLQFSTNYDGIGKIIDGIVEIPTETSGMNTLILSCNASCPIQWHFYPAKVI